MKVVLKKCDTQHLIPAMDDAKAAALGLVAENALSDCTPMVPKDTGDLRRSGKTLIGNTRAYLLWGTDAKTAQYARIQYYKSLNHTTPGTCDRWFERTKTRRGKVWEQMYSQEYKRRIKR